MTRPRRIGPKISKTLILGSTLQDADGPRPVIPAERNSPAGTRERGAQTQLLKTKKSLDHESSWTEIVAKGSKALQLE